MANNNKQPQWSHPVIGQVVDMIGWDNLAKMIKEGQEGQARDMFIKLFNAHMARYKNPN